MNTKNLKILNASAGSGKTYNLVLTYLKIVLDKPELASSFSQIIAMTFTNKAAFEMKKRIIAALDLLAHHVLGSTLEKHAKTQQLVNRVVDELGVSELMIQQKAGQVLKQLLHQFEDFNVLTIDKFNLRLIRSFAKELNIPADFQISLRENEVLNEVIDGMMDRLDPSLTPDLTSLVLSYAKDKLDDEESWNFQNDLKRFASVLTNEKYFSMVIELIEADYDLDSLPLLKNRIKNNKEHIQDKANVLHNLFLTIDVSSLPGKSVTGKAYSKLIQGNMFDVLSPEGFFSTHVVSKFDLPNFPQELAHQSTRFNEAFLIFSEQYQSDRLIVKNFYNMALLRFISKELEIVRDRSQTIRISEFNKLISSLISEEEAPFIYEKLGNRFKHYLLDEFQDTSRLQWLNIVPLIHESLSKGHVNLIVGDPKQSIYRFKNGIAEQFVSLPSIYNPEEDPKIKEKSHYFENAGFVYPLEDNFRSRKEIVSFNNDFFKSIRKLIDTNFISFYKDVEQNPKGNEGGYIEIVSLNGLDNSQELQMIKLSEWINQCIIEDGFDPGDICILGNTKKECNRWAIELSKTYKVVSDDSLLVNSDAYVRLIISYLKWKLNPSGELEAKRFSELYLSLFTENPVLEQQRFWKKDASQQSKSYFDTSEFISFYFQSKEKFFFKFTSIYSLCLDIYILFSLDELQNPYLHHFSDLALAFDSSTGPNLSKFISDYDTALSSTSIQIPENKDAIKIMTGHKAKGLEFPIVIIPNMDFSFNTSFGSHLLKLKEHFIYVKSSVKSPLSVIQAFSIKENAQVFIDKLNLCYVMMTRPVDRLYIGNYYKSSKEKNFGYYFDQALVDFPLYERFLSEEGVFSFGTKEKKIISEISELSYSFCPESVRDNLWFPEIAIMSEELQESKALSDPIRFGYQLHDLISILDSESEVEAVIDSYCLEGKLDAQFVPLLKKEVLDIFNNPIYKGFILNASSISNEQTIIVSENELKRIDKIIFKPTETIVIDFKTGAKDNKHLKQVSFYKKIITKMGYPNVKSFLFYTNLKEIVEVA